MKEPRAQPPGQASSTISNAAAAAAAAAADDDDADIDDASQRPEDWI
jgi:hypothetical protein